jgi:hypothetical protein
MEGLRLVVQAPAVGEERERVGETVSSDLKEAWNAVV